MGCAGAGGGGRGLASDLASIPDGATVLLDGLLASPAPEILVPEARRLRQVVLMHMPLGTAQERAVGARGGGGRRRDERVDEAAAGRAVRDRQGARGGAGRGGGRARAGERARRQAPLCGGGDAGQGPRRPARRARRRAGPALALRMRRQPDPRRRPRRADGPPRPLVERPRALRRREDRRRVARGVRGGGPVGAPLSRGDVRDGRDGGAGPRRAGGGRRCRRRPRGARPRGGRHTARAAGPPDDFVALGEALRSWLGEELLRARLRRAARQRRETLRSWSQTTAEVAGGAMA